MSKRIDELSIANPSAKLIKYQQIYDLLSKKSKSISNPKRIFGKMINLQEALNG